MSFHWTHEDAAGRPAGRSRDFPTRQEAEDWMGHEFQALLDSGAVASTLYDGEARLYRMKLTPD